jgi:hypothetical protein
MNLLLHLVFLAFPSIGTRAAQGSTHPRIWAPAVYHGLVVGKSTRGEVLKTLGKPTSKGIVADSNTPYIGYGVTDPVPGTLMVIISRGVLRKMYLYPKPHVTIKDAIAKFGPDYQIARYSIDGCLTQGGIAPMYEDPEGQFEQIEYRLRAIALNQDGGVVDTIMFVAEPFGARHPRCKGLSKKTEKK